MAEHETVRAPRTNIRLAGKQGYCKRPRCPPPLEQLGLGPGLEHDARRGVAASRNNKLTLGPPFDRRAVLAGGGPTLSLCVHRPSLSVSIPRRSCPTR